MANQDKQHQVGQSQPIGAATIAKEPIKQCTNKQEPPKVSTTTIAYGQVQHLHQFHPQQYSLMFDLYHRNLFERFVLPAAAAAAASAAAATAAELATRHTRKLGRLDAASSGPEGGQLQQQTRKKCRRRRRLRRRRNKNREPADCRADGGESRYTSKLDDDTAQHAEGATGSALAAAACSGQ